MPVSGGDQLRARLARAVRVGPPERIGLPISIVPLPVEVALVRSDDLTDADGRRGPDRFQNVDRSEHIGLERVLWVAVRVEDEWLGREMEHDFRGDRANGVDQLIDIPNVADMVAGEAGG